VLVPAAGADVITVEKDTCHDTCLVIEGGEHRPEINETGDGRSRLECPQCSTVLKIFRTQQAAIIAGKEHAVDPERWLPW
jgi:hypothetical protein